MIANIVQDTLVPHTAFNAGLERLEQHLRFAADAVEPVCLAVLGVSRTGKTRLIEEFMENHVRQIKKDGAHIPVLRAATPARPTVKGLAEELLKEIGDPAWYRDTENRKTSRLRTLLEGAGTHMIVLDEFQHFRDKGSDKVMHEVADWLKNLVNESKVALTVVGLPTCRIVIRQNEQLAGRFSNPIVMPRFDWKDEGQQREFRRILEAYRRELGRHFKLPELESDPTAFRCYCATGGLIGYLTKFLRQAVWDALDDKRKSISLNDLMVAHAKSVWDEAQLPGFANPFDRKFDSTASVDLLAKVAEIGQPKLTVRKSRRAHSANS